MDFETEFQILRRKVEMQTEAVAVMRAHHDSPKKLKASYVAGDLDLETFEDRLGRCLRVRRDPFTDR